MHCPQPIRRVSTGPLQTGCLDASTGDVLGGAFLTCGSVSVQAPSTSLAFSTRPHGGSYSPFALGLAFSHSDDGTAAAAAPAPAYVPLHLLVDPTFADKFQVARPSAKLTANLETLGHAFVGPPEDLRALVTALAAVLRADFAAKGLSLPPWRSVQSLLAVWLPLDGRRMMRLCPTPRHAPLSFEP